MRLGRRIPAVDRQPELQNFECRACSVVVTEAMDQTQAPAPARSLSWTISRPSLPNVSPKSSAVQQQRRSPSR